MPRAKRPALQPKGFEGLEDNPRIPKVGRPKKEEPPKRGPGRPRKYPKGEEPPRDRSAEKDYRSGPGKASPFQQKWVDRSEIAQRRRALEQEAREQGVTWYDHDYNLRLPIELTRRELELLCFRVNHPVEKGGLGRFGHLKKIQEATWPEVEWNPWLEWIVSSLCDDSLGVVRGNSIFRNVALAGCATSGKTFAAGFFTFIWWMASPLDSIAVLTSTTKEMIRRRVWPIVQDMWGSAMDDGQRLKIGHMLDSRTALQAVKGNDKNSIFAQAVAMGETAKAIENIKGQHAKRILLCLDEATGTPEAVPSVIPNMRKSCEDFTLLTIGNPVSHMDPHGRICEPMEGWDSITVDSRQWRTKGVKEWQIDPGVCLHLDGSRSPNVLLGETRWPYIYTYEDYQLALQERGEESVMHWSMDRGFWAGAGVLNTVLSEQAVVKYDLRGEHYFPEGKVIPVAGLDPAFGGDQCVLRGGLKGRLANGRWGVQLTWKENIRLSATSKDEPSFQIANRTRELCSAKGVTPENLAVDATGTGRGVAEVLRQQWGQVIKVEFGGAASTWPVSEDDNRPAKDLYDRRVTELWFRVKTLAEGGQLRGFDNPELVQFCAREFSLKGNRYRLDTKDECREKIGRSPDDADAVAVLCQTLLDKEGVSGIGGAQWEAFILDAQDVFAD